MTKPIDVVNVGLIIEVSECFMCVHLESSPVGIRDKMVADELIGLISYLADVRSVFVVVCYIEIPKVWSQHQNFDSEMITLLPVSEESDHCLISRVNMRLISNIAEMSSPYVKESLGPCHHDDRIASCSIDSCSGVGMELA